jgi:hypothetical protein
MRVMVGAVVIGVTLGAQMEPTCAHRTTSLQQIGRARLSELEHAEDAAWGILREGLARCAPVDTPCEAARRADFDAGLARARTLIEERYRRVLEEFEARCRLPVM